MKGLKYIFWAAIFVATAAVVVYLQQQAADQEKSILQFKYNLMQKIQSDSLDAHGKVKALRYDTAKFIDGSARVKSGVHYLQGLLVCWVIGEVIFLVVAKRRTQ